MKLFFFFRYYNDLWLSKGTVGKCIYLEREGICGTKISWGKMTNRKKKSEKAHLGWVVITAG